MNDFNELELALRASRREQILQGHDWDIADVLPVVKTWVLKADCDDPEDITEVKARALVSACNGLGLAAQYYWDRGPSACQVFLTNDHDEYAPSIFFMLEDSDTYKIQNNGNLHGWIWHGQLRLGEDLNLPELSFIESLDFTILERNHLGDDEHSTARTINSLVSMLDISALPLWNS